MTLARFLGHANPSITLDRYVHAADDHKRESVERLDSLYAGISPVTPLHTQEAEELRKFTLKRKT